MEIRVLKYFLTIAAEENITRAAQILHVTQPTLSRQIADLEKELGVKLFVRGNHNTVLTEEGLIFKRRAQEIMSLVDKTKKDFLSDESILEGTISIGSGEYRSTKILTDCIAQFHKIHPLVRYEFYSGNTGNIKDYIERGLLDIGLMLEPADNTKYEFITIPIKEQWGAFVQNDSPLANKEFISAEDLLDIPLISTTGENAKNNIRSWLGNYIEKIDVIAEGNLLYNQAILAQSNLGATIGVKLDCVYNGLKFVPFDPPLEAKTVLVWKKDQVFSLTIKKFIEFTKEYISSISNNKI